MFLHRGAAASLLTYVRGNQLARLMLPWGPCMKRYRRFTVLMPVNWMKSALW